MNNKKRDIDYFIVEVTLVDYNYYEQDGMPDLNPPRWRSLFAYDHFPSILEVKGSMENAGLPDWSDWLPDLKAALSAEWSKDGWAFMEKVLLDEQSKMSGTTPVIRAVVVKIQKRKLNG